MGFARFFIDRPILAGVLSLLIVIAGALSVGQLPLSEYPAVAPPTVSATKPITRSGPRSRIVRSSSSARRCP